MEGRWRSVALAAMAVASCALTVGATGCGDDETSAAGSVAVQTANPERTFAPLVEVAAGEPWRPMGVHWFVERSVFWFADPGGCPDRKIAVGHTMPEQQSFETGWIVYGALGGWSQLAYYRYPHDAECELDIDLRFYADQLTRPHDPGPRVDGIRPGEGFYLDLVDDARPGPPFGGSPATAVTAPAYAERTDEGDSVVRLTYWLLFGMDGRPGRPGAHEGDWERIDVLLRAAGEDRYEPLEVQVARTGAALTGSTVEDFRGTPWGASRRAGETHPVVTAARATHRMEVAERAGGCAGCVPWRTWETLVDARKEVWYGFGGAWGELGATSATTGPIGPHRFWPSASEKRREIFDG